MMSTCSLHRSPDGRCRDGCHGTARLRVRSFVRVHGRLSSCCMCACRRALAVWAGPAGEIVRESLEATCLAQPRD